MNADEANGPDGDGRNASDRNPSDASGREAWRPARESKAQRAWTPGQPKKARSIRATFTSTVLVMEAFVLVFFGLAMFGVNRGTPMASWALGISLALAAVAVLDCALVRKPVGIWIGWVIQILLVASAFIEYTMAIVGVGFGLAWWYAVTKGAQIDRENVRRAEAEARWREDHPDAV
ncbi:DUF4233 domain-containing protein [Cellulosimicrobium funkei]|nr:DUF4233 domain-containing protein [Cellulosimicrobium funkei]